MQLQGQHPTDFRQIRFNLDEGRTDVEPMGTMCIVSEPVAMPRSHDARSHLAVFAGAKNGLIGWTEMVFDAGVGHVVRKQRSLIDVRLVVKASD